MLSGLWTAAIWGLASMGAVGPSMACALFLRRRHPDLAEDVMRAMQRGDFAEARAICAVAPPSPASHVARAALELRLDDVAIEGPAGAGYRQAPEVVSLDAEARAALEPIAARELASAQRLMVAALFGGALCAVSLLPPWPAVPTLLAGLGIAMSAAVTVMFTHTRRDVERLLERLPGLVRPSREMHPTPRASPPLLVEIAVSGPDRRHHHMTFDQDLIRIGSSRHADLRLDHPSVGLVHAHVVRRPTNELVIIDRGYGGTMRNGADVQAEPLAPDDVVTIGPFRLVIRPQKQP